jgi:hypothetical protein
MPSYESKQARIVVIEETAIARQWLSKHVPASMNTQNVVKVKMISSS